MTVMRSENGIAKKNMEMIRPKNAMSVYNMITACRGNGFHRTAVTGFALPRTDGVCAVDVLNPRSRITASKSAFWSGFESDAANSALASPISAPLYALTAMIGVLVFLLLVLLMYRAALSPSTVGVALGE